MLQSNLFREKVRPLLCAVNADSEVGPDATVCEFRFSEEIDVVVQGIPSGFLTVSAVFRRPVDLSDAESLMRLLALNRGDDAYPMVSASLDQRTHRRVIWARQPIEQLDGHGVIDLVNRVMARAVAS